MKKTYFILLIMLIGMYTFAYNPPDTENQVNYEGVHPATDDVVYAPVFVVDFNFAETISDQGVSQNFVVTNTYISTFGDTRLEVLKEPIIRENVYNGFQDVGFNIRKSKYQKTLIAKNRKHIKEFTRYRYGCFGRDINHNTTKK